MSNLRVFLCWVAVFLTVACSTGTFAASFDEAAEQELLRLANKERDRKGLPPLEFNAQLRQAAREHAKLMAPHLGGRSESVGEQDRRAVPDGLGVDSDTLGFLAGSPVHRRGFQMPSERPTISFMISLVPP